jgi:uncharacterized membrane protein
MALMLAGLVLFLGSHSLSIMAPRLRERLVARLGPGAFRGLYSIVALAGLVLVVRGFPAARAAGPLLYAPPLAFRYLAIGLLALVFPLALASGLPGRIQRTLQHPLLAATKTWAFAHLLANGTLADLLLFGSLLAWAVLDRISLKRRPPRPVPMAPARGYNDLIAVVLGLVLYAAFLGGVHAWLFGVAPLP